MEFVQNFTLRIFRLKLLHRKFHLISTVLVRKNTKKNERKWRNLHRWEKFYTAAGSDGMDKFHLWMLPERLSTHLNFSPVEEGRRKSEGEERGKAASGVN